MNSAKVASGNAQFDVVIFGSQSLISVVESPRLSGNLPSMRKQCFASQLFSIFGKFACVGVGDYIHALGSRMRVPACSGKNLDAPRSTVSKQ